MSLMGGPKRDSTKAVTQLIFTLFAGKSQRMMVYDPRIPLDMTPYVESTSRFLDYPVQKLFHPPGTDLVLGVGFTKQLVVWRYNPFGAHRVMRGGFDSIECMVVVKRSIGRRFEDLRNQGLVSTSLPTEGNAQSRNEPVVVFGQRGKEEGKFKKEVSYDLRVKDRESNGSSDAGSRISSGAETSTSGSRGGRPTDSKGGSFTSAESSKHSQAHSIQVRGFSAPLGAQSYTFLSRALEAALKLSCSRSRLRAP